MSLENTLAENNSLLREITQLLTKLSSADRLLVTSVHPPEQQEQETEPKPEKKAEPEPKAEPKPEKKAEPEPKAEPKPEKKAKPKAEPKAKAEAEPKAKAEAEPKAELTTGQLNALARSLMVVVVNDENLGRQYAIDALAKYDAPKLSALKTDEQRWELIEQMRELLRTKAGYTDDDLAAVEDK